MTDVNTAVTLGMTGEVPAQVLQRARDYAREAKSSETKTYVAPQFEYKPTDVLTAAWPCPKCSRAFKTAHGVKIHMGRAHD